jgi:Protein of unknown function (DUF1572).
MEIGKLYLDSAIKRFAEYKSLGEKTFEQLKDEEFFIQPNDDSNSIAIIIQHLHGNMLSRWTNFLTEDGEKSWRLRDEEFEEQQYGRKQLLEKWDEGWKVFLDTLQSIRVEDLEKMIQIRNQPLTVIDAINRQLAHYSYHIGQIVYLGRWFRQENWKSLSIPKRRKFTS